MITVIVPLYNGGAKWIKSAYALSMQIDVDFKVICIDSSSRDNSAQIADQLGFNIVKIAQADFNHGGTRNAALTLAPESDIYVFMTQDAILAHPNALSILVDNFKNNEISAVCGRQLAHKDANLIARFAREFNYPEHSSIKSYNDRDKLGIKTAFMSNSFAAYRGSDFREMGGFANDLILGEDMCLSAKMLISGKKVAYCAGACVFHSHNYTPWQEFKRYFDTGVLHAQQAWLLNEFGSAKSEGLKYIQAEYKFLKSHRAYGSILRALLHNALKLCAYKLGRKYRYLPMPLRKFLSMHRGYWIK